MNWMVVDFKVKKSIQVKMVRIKYLEIIPKSERTFFEILGFSHVIKAEGK